MQAVFFTWKPLQTNQITLTYSLSWHSHSPISLFFNLDVYSNPTYHQPSSLITFPPSLLSQRPQSLCLYTFKIHRVLASRFYLEYLHHTCLCISLFLSCTYTHIPCCNRLFLSCTCTHIPCCNRLTILSSLLFCLSPRLAQRTWPITITCHHKTSLFTTSQTNKQQRTTQHHRIGWTLPSSALNNHHSNKLTTTSLITTTQTIS